MANSCRAIRPRLQSIRISQTAWYYEEEHGITVVAEERNPNGILHCVVQTKIPWAKLESSVRRHQKRKTND